MSNSTVIIISITVLAGVFLLLQPWFWVALLFLLAVAAFLSMLASIFHFQIFAAMGFLFLGMLLWWVMVGVYEINYANN